MLTLARWMFRLTLALFVLGTFVFLAAGMVQLFSGIGFRNPALLTVAIIGSLSMMASLLAGLLGLIAEQIHDGRFNLRTPDERK